MFLEASGIQARIVGYIMHEWTRISLVPSARVLPAGSAVSFRAGSAVSSVARESPRIR